MRRVKVAASDWEQKAKGGWADFPPENTVDGKVTGESSWRAEGDGQWMQYDLGRAESVVAVELAFFGGDTRRYTFSIETSADGETWRAVHEGTSGGKTDDFERFDIDAADARYVRVVGHGNTNEEFAEWINLTEVRIHVAKR